MLNAESSVEILKNYQVDLTLIEAGPRFFPIRGRMHRKHGNAIDFSRGGMIFDRRKPPLFTCRDVHNVTQFPIGARFQLTGGLQTLIARPEGCRDAIDVVRRSLGNGRGRLVGIEPEAAPKESCGQEEEHDKRPGNYELNPVGIGRHIGRLYCKNASDEEC